jgi:hypothetical protein
MVQVSIVMPKDHAANCCCKGTGHIKKASAPDDASSSPLSRFFLNVTRPIYTKLWPGNSSIMTSYLSSDLPSIMMLFTSTGILLWLPPHSDPKMIFHVPVSFTQACKQPFGSHFSGTCFSINSQINEAGFQAGHGPVGLRQ